MYVIYTINMLCTNVIFAQFVDFSHVLTVDFPTDFISFLCVLIIIEKIAQFIVAQQLVI